MIGKRTLLKLFHFLTASSLIKRTSWYKSLFVDYNHELYPSNIWYRNHLERNCDVVNLGSSAAKWAFDYSHTGIWGMNWAQQPQTLYEDFRLLRNFHSILKRNGTVLITIMPFTSLNKQTGMMDALKYLRLGTHEPIEPHLVELAERYANYPILFKKPAVKALIKYLLNREEKYNNSPIEKSRKNPFTSEQLEIEAKAWIDGWKKQFSISDFAAPLTSENEEGRAIRIHLMREIVDFCIERGYRPVYVIPPVTKHLAKYFTPVFENIYIYSFLKDVNREVQLLDYSKSEDFMNDDLFFNSFFLNAHGREIFTDKVLTDLLIKKSKLK